MELFEAIQQRRSVRAFRPVPVGDELVGKLLKAAVAAPSALNLQPWEFVLVKSAEAKAKIKAVCQQAKDAVVAADGPGWVAKYSFDYLDQAPVCLVVLYNPSKGGLGAYFNNPDGALSSTCAAVQNLMLAATEEGLATVWLTFFDPAKLARAVGAPDKLKAAGVLPLGFPEGETKAPPRKDPKLFIDSYPA